MHNFSEFKYQLTELDHFKIEMKAHEYNLSQKYYEIDRNVKQIIFQDIKLKCIYSDH